MIFPGYLFPFPFHSITTQLMESCSTIMSATYLESHYSYLLFDEFFIYLKEKQLSVDETVIC